MSTIDRATVAHLARLARLAIPEDQLDAYASQLDVILTSVARVSDVAAADVPPNSHPLPLVNVFRDDAVITGLTPDEALAMAPAAEDGRFRVPRILDEE